VVEALAQASGALSALQVFDASRARCPDLGLTTVYRTLDLLSDVGAIRRVHGDGHCETFVPAETHHGHSVVCGRCGRVAEFTDCDVSGLIVAATRETGFSIDQHLLQLSGVCAECQEEDRSQASAAPRTAAPKGARR
jgi:Fur family ferric uptake transcriptional regulator